MSADVAAEAPRAWHVAHAPGVDGPLATAELVAAIRAGRVPPDASAWADGMPAWRGVADIPELRPAFAGRGLDALPRRQLLLLGGLSVASGGLLLVANTARALSGHEVGAAWAGIAGALAAPGVLMLWKAFRRRG